MGGIGYNPFKGKRVTKNLYNTDLIAVEVFQNDVLQETIQRLALERVKKGYDGRTFVMQFGNTGAAQFFQYYLSGKYDYVDYLPEVQVSAVGIPTSALTDIIDGLETDTVYVKSTEYKNLTEPDWIIYNLQEAMNYNVSGNFVKQGSDYYRISSYTYNGSTNQFNVVLSTLPLFIATLQQTSVNITPKDAVNDSKQVIVKNIVTYKDRTTNNAIFSETTIVSNTTTDIPKDSENNSIDTVDLGTVDYNPASQSISAVVNAYDPTKGYYIVKYLLMESNLTKYWIYDPNSNTYPQINPNVYTSVSYESYPITTLRNAYFSVEEYDIDSKVIQGDNISETMYRPATITEDRYEETSKLVSNMGLRIEDLMDNIESNPDVDRLQDAFMVVGVAPGKWNTPETKPQRDITSQALYRMFDYIYNLLPPTQFSQDTIYYATFDEAPYNADVKWIPYEPRVTDEVIGLPGTYTHSVGNTPISFPTYHSRTYYSSALSEFINIGYDDLNQPMDYRITTRSDGSKWVYMPGIILDAFGNRSLDTKAEDWVRVDSINYGNGTADLTQFIIVNISTLTIKKQINETQTRTLIVGDPGFRDGGIYMGGNYVTTVSVEAGAEGSGNFELSNVITRDVFWTTTISRGDYSGTVELTFTDENLLIPLPVAVVEDMTYMDRTALLGASLHLVFYAASVQHIVYYRGTMFGAMLQVISMVIVMVVAVLTYQYELVAGLAAGLTAAAAASAAAAIVLSEILLPFLIGFALSIVLKIITDVIKDPYLSMALSAAAMITAAFLGSGGFQLPNLNFSTVTELANLTTSMGDMLVGAKVAEINEQMQGIQQQMNQLNQNYNDISKQYGDIINQMSYGISTEQVVDMTINGSSNMLINDYSTFSPSLLRSIATDGYRNYDLLYTNKITDYCSNSLRLGILDI